MASGTITSWEIDGETMETVSDFIFGGSRQHIEKQRYYFANKDPSSQGYGFSSSHLWM